MEKTDTLHPVQHMVNYRVSAGKKKVSFPLKNIKTVTINMAGLLLPPTKVRDVHTNICSLTSSYGRATKGGYLCYEYLLALLLCQN